MIRIFGLSLLLSFLAFRSISASEDESGPQNFSDDGFPEATLNRRIHAFLHDPRRSTEATFLDLNFDDRLHTPLFKVLRSPLGNLIQAAKKTRRTQLHEGHLASEVDLKIEIGLMQFSRVITHSYFSSFDLYALESFVSKASNWQSILRLAIPYARSRAQALRWTTWVLGAEALSPDEVIGTLSFYASHLNEKAWLTRILTDVLRSGFSGNYPGFKDKDFNQKTFLLNLTPLFLALPSEEFIALLSRWPQCQEILDELIRLDLIRPNLELTDKGLKTMKQESKRLLTITHLKDLPTPQIPKPAKSTPLFTRALWTSTACFSHLWQLGLGKIKQMRL